MGRKGDACRSKRRRERSKRRFACRVAERMLAEGRVRSYNYGRGFQTTMNGATLDWTADDIRVALVKNDG